MGAARRANELVEHLFRLAAEQMPATLTHIPITFTYEVHAKSMRTLYRALAFNNPLWQNPLSRSLGPHRKRIDLHL
jgi:hypothetical protein